MKRKALAAIGKYMDQRFLSGDRSGETAADFKRAYRRGGRLGRRISQPALPVTENAGYRRMNLSDA